MLERLKELALRRENLEAQLTDPAVYGDGKKLAAIQRELKELTPVVEAAGSLEAAERRRAEAEGPGPGGAVRRQGGGGSAPGGAETAASAPGPQRRAERHPGASGRGGR